MKGVAQDAGDRAIEGDWLAWIALEPDDASSSPGPPGASVFARLPVG